MQGSNPDEVDQSTETPLKPVSSFSPFVPVQPVVNELGHNDHWIEPRHVLPRRSSLNLQPQQQQQQQQHGISGRKAGYQSILMPTSTVSSSLSKPAYTVPRSHTGPIYHNGISSPVPTFSPTLSMGSLNSPLNISSARTPPNSSLQPELYYKMTDSLSPSLTDRGLITSPFIPQPVQATSTVPLRRATLTQSDLPSYRKIQPERSNPRARKRSANISELKFSHFYHPTEKPFNRIRVWKNNRNLLFYDCDCGRRKAVQDLKKILNHVSKNCRLSDNDDKCGSGIDSPYDGQIDQAAEEGDIKATPADIAAAAAILTMSSANVYRNDAESSTGAARHTAAAEKKLGGVHPH